MNVLIDTDVLLDLALNREPFAEDAARLLDAAQEGRVNGWVALHTLANIYYLCSKEGDDQTARDFIREVVSFVRVAPAGVSVVQSALSLRMRDFEDALQAGSAIECRAEFIVTRNHRDYRHSPVRVLTPAQALARS